MHHNTSIKMIRTPPSTKGALKEYQDDDNPGLHEPENNEKDNDMGDL